MSLGVGTKVSEVRGGEEVVPTSPGDTLSMSSQINLPLEENTYTPPELHEKGSKLQHCSNTCILVSSIL